MGMAALQEFTAQMVRAIPDDGRRYEVVDGVLLVTPSPRRVHQYAVGRLFRLLAEFAENGGFGVAITSPSDIELDSRSLVQPDVYVEGLVDGRPAGDWNLGAKLLL